MAISTAAIGPIARHYPIRWRRVTGPPRRAAVAVVAARKAIEGVSEELNAVAAENLDFAPARRRVRAAFADVQRRLDHFLFKVPQHRPDPALAWPEMERTSFGIF